MKRNNFILQCFKQFTCTNLDGFQKGGSNFLNLLQKELGGTQKAGAPPPQKRGGGTTLEETMNKLFTEKDKK